MLEGFFLGPRKKMGGAGGIQFGPRANRLNERSGLIPDAAARRSHSFLASIRINCRGGRYGGLADLRTSQSSASAKTLRAPKCEKAWKVSGLKKVVGPAAWSKVRLRGGRGRPDRGISSTRGHRISRGIEKSSTRGFLAGRNEFPSKEKGNPLCLQLPGGQVNAWGSWCARTPGTYKFQTPLHRKRPRFGIFR